MRTVALLALLFVSHCTSPPATPPVDRQPKRYSFLVEVIGHGRPVILIPGLTCGGSVWAGTVAHLMTKYECHVLTLPGFSGQPPIQGPYLSHVRDDILAYVKDKKLENPIVIGHSLGGFMVFYLGVAAPHTFRSLVSVDGLPYLATIYNPKATPENMTATAEMIAKQMAGSTHKQFEAGIHSSLSQQITDPKKIAATELICDRSDPANTGEAMKELLTTDLRAEVSKIQSPVLLLGAGQWAHSTDQRKELVARYTDQIKTMPRAKLVVAWKAKHFIMLDDPEFFYKALDDFLSSH